MGFEVSANASRQRLGNLALVLGLGLLFAVFVWINTGPLRLVAEIVSEKPNAAQLFYSPDGTWSEAQSQTQPLQPGMNHVVFRLERVTVGREMRLDPGHFAGIYRILSLRLESGFFGLDTPLGMVQNPRPDALGVRWAQGGLELTATDDDPQLIVPIPGGAWRIGSLALPFAAVAVGILALLFAVLIGRIGPLGIANAYLVAWISFYCALFVKYGPTLPFFDDWRYVLPGETNLTEGHWDWLKVVGNDTYFLTGQVIDFIVLRLSNVDFVALRTVALGLLLVQAWAMHRIVLRASTAASGSGAQWIPSVGIALLVWSFASNNYWGGTAIAYHQFLPVLFGTLMLVHLSEGSGEFRARWSVTLIVLVALASGLAYVSGGIFILALSGALLLVHSHQLRPGFAGPEVRAALALFVLGAVLLLIQVALVNHVQGSLLERSHATATVWPTDRRFWLFFMAQFGRALGYSGYRPEIDVLLALLVLAPAVALGADRVWNGLVRGHPCERRLMTALPLYAGIASVGYVAAFAFGRAGFAAPDASVDMALFTAKGRFHYWPVAALLPFLWLGWVEFALRLRGRFGLVLISVAVVMLVPKSTAPWDLVGAFRTTVDPSARGADCIANHLVEGPVGKPLICEAITGTPVDLTGTMKRLRDDNRVLYRDIERYRQSAPIQGQIIK